MTVSPWLQELVDAVAEQMCQLKLAAPVGCHFHEVDECWEVSLFASSTEIVGGFQDGRCRQSVFCMDLLSLLPLFDEIAAVRWQNQPAARNDELGAHLAIDGRKNGYSVSLRVLAKAPRRFDCGQQIRVHENAVVQTW